jgi:predicted acyltransferase
MFMVGVAIPYSHAGRKAKGDSETKIWLHNGLRAVLLVLLGVFLSSNWSEQTNWSFVNVLSQIGLGYVFVCLLRGAGLRVQLAALAATLAGYWLWFALWPVPPSGLDHAVGLPATTHHLSGFFAHWDRCTNPAAAFDSWFLNLFPRGKPFVANEEGYVTLNFIPSMGTMILGLMAGELLRGPKSGLAKFGALVAAGSACLLLGCLAGWTVCPIVKKIWTPSWTLYSGGWVLWLLAAFYGLLDLRGWKGWAFPFTVVGMNSIAIYCMSQLLRPWIKNTFHIHIVTPLQGRLGTAWWDGTFGPMVQCAVILAVLWLACWWMYRRGIFLRI